MQPVIVAPDRRSRPWPAALAGFLTAAVIFVVLVLIGVLRSNDNSTPSRFPITMPRTLGNYAWAQVVQHKLSNGSHVGAQLANERLSAVKTAAALSAAHDGASAAVQAYADPYLHNVFTVLAVRDATPAPVLGIESPKVLGRVAPQRIVRVGSSYCEVDMVQPSPVAEDIASCQRSSAALTVIVLSGSAPDPHPVVAFLDRMWHAIS